jgi:exopolysaccharide biosynthesis polyprenyl glycosylphosphotransferase
MAVRFIEKFTTFLFDIIAINIALFTAFWLRYKSNLFPEAFDPNLLFISYVNPAIILTTGWLVLFFFTGLYRDWYKESRIDEFFVVSRTVLIGIFFLFLLTIAPQIMEFSHNYDFSILFTRTRFAIILTYATCMMFFATVVRFTMHTILGLLFSKGIAAHNVIIIGATSTGQELLEELNKFPKLGYRFKGFIDDDGRKKGTTFANYPIFGTYSDIPSIIKKEKIEGLIITQVSSSANEILKIVEYCGDSRVTIYMTPSLMDIITGHLKTHQIFGVPLMVLLQDHMPAWEAQIKRLMDISVSLAVLVLGAPVWLLTALMVKWTSKGPAVFAQERVGRNGKHFIMYKFRSMREDAEKISGPKWATENDPRITPFGRFMRKTRLDEIPQFINVLKGEMSLVGPRPERQYFVDKLKKEIPWYVRRIKMKPGITGWAQVKHKYDETIEDVKQKVTYDLYYFENMSLLLDIKIIVRTIWVAFTGKGAH